MTLSPGPTHASALPASAESTVQANVSRDGGRGAAGESGHGDAHPVLAQGEVALQVRAGCRLGEQHAAGLVHRDAQVLDLVQGEVQAGRQARRGRPQDRQVRPLGWHADGHLVLDGTFAPRPRPQPSRPLARPWPPARSSLRSLRPPLAAAALARPPSSCLQPTVRDKRCRRIAPPQMPMMSDVLGERWYLLCRARRHGLVWRNAGGRAGPRGLRRRCLRPAGGVSPAWSPRRSWRSPRSCRAARRPCRRPRCPWCRRRPPAWWPR